MPTESMVLKAGVDWDSHRDRLLEESYAEHHCGEATKSKKKDAHIPSFMHSAHNVSRLLQGKNGPERVIFWGRESRNALQWDFTDPNGRIVDSDVPIPITPRPERERIYAPFHCCPEPAKNGKVSHTRSHQMMITSMTMSGSCTVGGDGITLVTTSSDHTAIVRKNVGFASMF